MTSPAELRKRLAAAVALEDRARRHLEAAAVIAEALRTVGQDPILVGGAALEFYTEGGYSTDDIDLLAQGGPALRRVMAALGFSRLGKDFVAEDLGLYVEFPGRGLGPTERTVRVQVRDSWLRVISREDLLVDRLCAFKFWRSALDGVGAMLLFELGEIDEERLLARLEEEDVADAFTAVREVLEEATRRRLTPSKANALLEKRMGVLIKG